jgi:hypothetical protein
MIYTIHTFAFCFLCRGGTKPAADLRIYDYNFVRWIAAGDRNLYVSSGYAKNEAQPKAKNGHKKRSPDRSGLRV